MAEQAMLDVSMIAHRGSLKKNNGDGSRGPGKHVRLSHIRCLRRAAVTR